MINILPINDAKKHIENEKCNCKPTVEIVNEKKIVIHNSFDKREIKEQVNNPQHYGGKDNPYEAIKVIEKWKLNFNLGNAIKYLARADHKNNKLQDLEKAKWYIQREINNLK